MKTQRQSISLRGPCGAETEAPPTMWFSGGIQPLQPLRALLFCPYFTAAVRKLELIVKSEPDRQHPVQVFALHHLRDSFVPVQKKVIIFSATAGTREKPKNIVSAHLFYPNSPQQSTHRLHKTPERAVAPVHHKSFFVEHIWKMLDLWDQEGQAHTSNLLKPFLNHLSYVSAKEGTVFPWNPVSDLPQYLARWYVHVHVEGTRHHLVFLLARFLQLRNTNPQKPTSPAGPALMLTCPSLRGVAMGTRLSKSCLDYVMVKWNLHGISKQFLKRIFTQGPLTTSVINRCMEI